MKCNFANGKKEIQHKSWTLIQGKNKNKRMFNCLIIWISCWNKVKLLWSLPTPNKNKNI